MHVLQRTIEPHQQHEHYHNYRKTWHAQDYDAGPVFIGPLVDLETGAHFIIPLPRSPHYLDMVNWTSKQERSRMENVHPALRPQHQRLWSHRRRSKSEPNLRLEQLELLHAPPAYSATYQTRYSRTQNTPSTMMDSQRIYDGTPTTAVERSAKTKHVRWTNPVSEDFPQQYRQ